MPTVQYTPLENGGYRVFARVPTSSRKLAEGEHNVAVVAPGSRDVAVVDRQGNEQFRHQADMVMKVSYQPGHDRYVVQDYGAIDLISARDGALQARIEPENQSHQSSLEVLSDGRMILNVARYDLKGQLMMLKPDLEPQWTHSTELLGARVLELPDGKVAAFAGPDLEICNERGEVVHRSCKMLTDPQLQDGKLVYLEALWMEERAGRVKERSNEVVLCQHDLKTGVTITHPARSNCETLTLLPDGRSLLSRRTAGEFGTSLHDANGKEIKLFPLPEDGFSSQLELSADGKKAYVTEGAVLANPVVFRAHEIDLEQLTMREVHRSPDPFFLSTLTDGRTAILDKNGIEMLEDGTRFAGTRELLAGLGPDVRPAYSRAAARVSHYLVPAPGPARWDQVLNHAQHQLQLQAAAALTAKVGDTFFTPDSCVNFMLASVDALPAAVAAAARPVKVSDLFHDRALPAWLSQEKAGLSIMTEDGKKTLSGKFGHILPFLTEGRPVVAAAEESKLLWWDPKRFYGRVSYEVGEPITSLEPGQDGASVIARTDSGQVLHLYPDKIERLQDETPAAPEDRPVGSLQEDQNGIRLPGVFIRKFKR